MSTGGFEWGKEEREKAWYILGNKQLLHLSEGENTMKYMWWKMTQETTVGEGG